MTPPPPPAPRRPLKILQVASHFPNWGGAEIHILNLTERLLARGHDVTVSCRPGYFVEREAQQRGFKIFHATVRKQQDWQDARPYGRFIKENKFDVVHSHWRADYLVAPTLARLAHVPVVVMSHHSPYPLQLKEVLFFPRFIRNRFIALSESVRQTLIRCGLRPDSVVTIHHGTDIAAFQKTTIPPESVRAEWGIPAGRVVIGIAGRLASEKGVTDVVRAMGNRPELPLHLVLIGAGKLEDEIRALCEARDLKDHVTFAGFRTDVNNAIAALDALILPSTWAEPCAAVVQQAMALGKPVVGTNTGGTPEMIVHEETGFISEPGAVDRMGDVLARLCAMTEEERSEMGERGRVRVESLFTLDIMVDKIEQLYYSEWECARQKNKGKVAQ
ncbi:MAG: glycosyltransferase family 4 protein [Akkermansiaceae bacterium]|nr:glycosyltransferase family 4 protein [Armatimonadota bacterium]